MIHVTKTYMPNKKRYLKYINDIYSRGWITNGGPLVKELEEKLSEYLGVENLVLVANGTLALEISYRALEINNFAITTPFSFVATTSSLVANNINPIFVDINPANLTIDEKKIEKYITKHTTAIVPVHVFGNACNVEFIDRIAKKYNLKVIYDGAHAFGVKYKNKSILKYGDITTLSFHATKLFHTIEGGALIVNDTNILEKIRYLINFGIKNEEEIPELGINAKMNEFEAAMGLCMLDEIDLILEKREELWNIYYELLKNDFKLQKRTFDTTNNFSYFPIILKDEEELNKIKNKLNQNSIFPRRYFYPSLDTLSYIEPKQCMKNSRDISKRILCLPLYPELTTKELNLIISTIKSTL